VRQAALSARNRLAKTSAALLRRSLLRMRNLRAMVADAIRRASKNQDKA